MEAAAHPHRHHHEHHEMPASGRALTVVALSATLHCLTGCAIGEILGMVIGTALGFSDLGTIALAVTLAFMFGYALTSLPLLRAGLTVAAVIPIALASDTASIAVMEIVDNGIMLLVPGAMEAGLDNVLFWGALSVALVVAGAVALPLNRWLIARGKGHAVVHETGIHGGPSPRLVGAIAVVAAVFGSTVLVADLVSSDDDRMGHGDMAAEHTPAAVRGVSASGGGVSLELATARLEPGRRQTLRFQIAGTDGLAVRDFEVEHEKRLHLIVARRDLAGFQHLHPRMAADGTWTTELTIAEPGDYRLYADFKRDGENQTLVRELDVPGKTDSQALPAPSPVAVTDTGYRVELDGAAVAAGAPAELAFTVSRDGEPVAVDDYLGAKGHLVALRARDGAYLHTHPEGGGEADAVHFETEFPNEGRYRLFLQFKHEGEVHTAAFTRTVAE